ncbi:glycoside hydrolase family 88 protein [Pedobacter arcticus]|uniref:glycoside hydrolase family 88 protein n=1 Tax=Pedobacter arcticus TaxID=752140 RepID=UPI0002E01795|nr:glycoside hydrolase family 88 protein [Pedobacter arcticus]
MIRYYLFFIALLAVNSSNAQEDNSSNKGLLNLINEDFKDADAQYKFFKTQIPLNELPRTLDEKGKLVTSGSAWWCSGFYPGTLLYLYENSKDTVLYNEAIRRLKLLEKEQYNKTTHDLGFMMYCSFGHANRLKANEKYKQILINSAKSLSDRFDPRVGCIRSWDSKKSSEFLVIIDNMMNLELLFYATKITGDSSYYKIAVSHADVTMKNHFRPDYSSYHLVDYNPETGETNVKRTHQGVADESSWARGQGWALYGYTTMYRETKDKKYLDFANNIANFILNHPNLPADKIPYWDFNAPEVPNALRDASAGSLIASALIELAGYNKGNVSKKYLGVARQIIKTLSTKEYKAVVGTNGGFLLKHSVGSMPHKSEIDVPLTYADYYYTEALLRYKNLIK